MNKFDETRVGFGGHNPLIKVGAKGYFGNDLISIKENIKLKTKNDTSLYGTLSALYFNEKEPYEDEQENCWKFFYVDEEAPTHRQFSINELLNYIGYHFTEICTGFEYILESVHVKLYGIDMNLLAQTNANNPESGKTRRLTYTGELLSKFTFADGKIAGAIKEQADEQI